jgi:hypothetical protein
MSDLHFLRSGHRTATLGKPTLLVSNQAGLIMRARINRFAALLMTFLFLHTPADLLRAKQTNPLLVGPENLLPVAIEGKHGFIDVNGRIVIPPTFEHARGFFDGRAVQRWRCKWTGDGVISTNSASMADRLRVIRTFYFLRNSTASGDSPLPRAKSLWILRSRRFIDRTGRAAIAGQFSKVAPAGSRTVWCQYAERSPRLYQQDGACHLAVGINALSIGAEAGI